MVNRAGVRDVPAAESVFSCSTEGRLTTLPVSNQRLWDYYITARDSFWTTNEIDISRDKFHFERLTQGEQHFIKVILAFFASSDNIVNINLSERFSKEVQIVEAGYYYRFQEMMEDIHAHMYSLMLENIISDATERERMFDAIKTVPVIADMAEYMFQCIESSAPLAERLLRMACVEGVFFSGCFCAIYWFKSRGLMPGLSHSNELIARDEGLHTEFSLALYGLVREEHKLSTTGVHELFRGATDIALRFVDEALKFDLPGMNKSLMREYIKFVADGLLAQIDVPVLYGAENPFAFMERLNMRTKANFFEVRPSEYSKASSATDLSMVDDF
jgi:ribonucleotide reductase beta subunit family protein with ferritin-like domain